MKLTPADDVRIRDEYATGLYTLQEVGARRGVSHEYVRQIVTGKVRPESGGPLSEPREMQRIRRQRMARRVRELFATGLECAQIAERVGLTTPTCREIVVGLLSPDAGGPIADRSYHVHPATALTDDQAREARELYATGRFSLEALAARYELESGSSMRRIIVGKSNPDAGGPVGTFDRGPIVHRGAPISDHERSRALRLLRRGLTQFEVARRVGLSQVSISRIARGVV